MKSRRDAREAEGARLEIVCSDKIGTEGSAPPAWAGEGGGSVSERAHPSLSAKPITDLDSLELEMKIKRRDAREAEGARLEIVCSDKIGTEGSNPSLSAINIVM